MHAVNVAGHDCVAKVCDFVRVGRVRTGSGSARAAVASATRIRDLILYLAKVANVRNLLRDEVDVEIALGPEKESKQYIIMLQWCAQPN